LEIYFCGIKKFIRSELLALFTSLIAFSVLKILFWLFTISDVAFNTSEVFFVMLNYRWIFTIFITLYAISNGIVVVSPVLIRPID